MKNAFDTTQYLISLTDYVGRLLYRKLFHRVAERKHVSGKFLLNSQDVLALYKQKLLSAEPFMAGRVGAFELALMDHEKRRRLGLEKKIPDTAMEYFCNNAGFFPKKKELVFDFYNCMADALQSADLIASWQDQELYYLKKYCKGAEFCRLIDIEPVLGDADSWVSCLAKKKVLVIHPFEKTIRSQYARREQVYPNGFLPAFELETIQAVQTAAGETDKRFKTWFDALDYMKQRMDETDYDIALIGCGAYGFPLAAHAKQQGKQAIHLGGALQLLFGIIGSRWEAKPYVQRVRNEFWVRPLPEETPSQAKRIENACYW